MVGPSKDDLIGKGRKPHIYDNQFGWATDVRCHGLGNGLCSGLLCAQFNSHVHYHFKVHISQDHVF